MSPSPDGEGIERAVGRTSRTLLPAASCAGRDGRELPGRCGMMSGMTAYPSAAAMAWDLAGQPRRDAPPLIQAPGLCAVCGTQADETVPAKATVANGTFTDQYLLTVPSSAVTCVPCAWAMSGRPPRSLRNWSIACAPGRDLGPSNPKAAAAVPGDHPGLLLTARDDMRPVARLLCDPPDGPWCAAVAESGQKHTLPFTPVNAGPGAWRVRMDAVTVASDPAVFAMLLGRSALLRAAGFGAAAIEALDPPVHLLDKARLAVWQQHAGHLAPWKASAPLHLANFMIKKEHYDYYAAAWRP
jgi:hypothetical protein